MSKFQNQPLLDEETLRSLDAEFQAGKFDDLVTPASKPIDPSRDPFGMNFEWLDPPELPPEQKLIVTIQSRTHEEWSRLASETIRHYSLAGTLAGGTNEELFLNWVKAGFVALCYADGATGEATLASARNKDIPIEERVNVLSDWLNRHTQFSRLTEDEKLAISIALVNHFTK
jgi:hypothetical protein